MKRIYGIIILMLLICHQSMAQNDTSSLVVPFGSVTRENTIDTSKIGKKTISDTLILIDLTIYQMHGAYKDMTPGHYYDSLPFSMDNIKGGWRRVVSSGYYTPNGDAMWEPNEVHGSIFFSENKVYYLTYPIRMHAYATYKIDAQGNVNLFQQKVLPDSLDGFSDSPDMFTKDSLTILFFDGQYYQRQEMDSSIVFELEQKTIRPEALIGDWIKTDTLTCCYGEIWWQEYPWDMPKNLHISKTWANKIYANQMIYIKIDGQLKPFFIAVLGEYEMELEAGSWFKGEADRVVYHRRWD